MTLCVGLSTVEITPPPGSPMAGFAVRTWPAEGVHDPLRVRALVVTDNTDDTDDSGGTESALVVADLIHLTPAQATEIRERIEHATGIPADAVIVATTHTHGGPAVDDRYRLSPSVRAYADTVIGSAVQSVVAAASSKVPARMLLNVGSEPTVGKNRRRAGGIMDPAVPTIRIEDEAGQVIGVVCSYACHPVTLGPDNHLITADYPGAVVQALEAVYPGAAAIFLTGCAGQINTGHAAEASLATNSSNVRTFPEMARLGRAIAGAAVQASEQSAGPRGVPLASAPVPGPSDQVSAATIRVAAPRLPVDAPDVLLASAAQWREALSSGQSSAEESGRYERWADWAERMAAAAPHDEHLSLDVTALRWGSICLVGLPGEPFVEFGLEIKERASAAVIVVGYAQGCPGYVPHRSAYDEGGYEVLHAHRGYGAPSAFAPEAGERLVEAALEAIATVAPTVLPPTERTFGQLTARIFPSPAQLGARTADDFAAALNRVLASRAEASVIFASANSQLPFLRELRVRDDIDWARVHILHMDEYIGVPGDHPASFRRFLYDELVRHVQPLRFHQLAGDATDPDGEIARYSDVLETLDPDICVLGIGDNGHLAFNDPPADFDTDRLVHRVVLDERCRRQQWEEGHFPNLADVPPTALSLTIRALLKPRQLFVVVPDRRKAAAVRAALFEPVSPNCPASILRTVPGVQLYLDADSAALLDSSVTKTGSR